MVALCGGTLVGVALLYYVGSGEATNYESAKAQFDEAAAQASGFESQPLYPTI